MESFEATRAGEDKLACWLASFGTVVLVGVEGTGSYGAGLARHLTAEGIDVVEVDRPNRQLRRRQGKTDPLDAIEAARAAQSGRALGIAKSRNGNVEAIRALVVVPLAEAKRIVHLSEAWADVRSANDSFHQALDDAARSGS